MPLILIELSITRRELQTLAIVVVMFRVKLWGAIWCRSLFECRLKVLSFWKQFLKKKDSNAAVEVCNGILVKVGDVGLEMRTKHTCEI